MPPGLPALPRVCVVHSLPAQSSTDLDGSQLLCTTGAWALVTSQAMDSRSSSPKWGLTIKYGILNWADRTENEGALVLGRPGPWSSNLCSHLPTGQRKTACALRPCKPAGTGRKVKPGTTMTVVCPCFLKGTQFTVHMLLFLKAEC